MSKQSRSGFAFKRATIAPERVSAAPTVRFSPTSAQTDASLSSEQRGAQGPDPAQPIAAKRIAYDYRLDRLLLVAGVSGSGKTTFIEKLSRGKLAPEIASALPRDAGAWSVVGGRKPRSFFRRLLGPRPAPGGQILHYEITHGFEPLRHDGHTPTRQLFSVADDPLLRRQLASARAIHVVIVSAPRAKLIRQLGARSFLLHVPAPLRPYAGWLVPSLQRLETLLPAWVKTNPGWLLGRRWRHRSMMRERNDQLSAIYAEPGALDAIHQHWLGTLLKECRGRIQEPLICVEPDPDAPGAFRLASGKSIFQALVRSHGKEPSISPRSVD